MAFLPPWHRRDAPDGGDLGRWISAVYEVVVEGVARAVSLARPHYGLVGVGPRKLGQRREWASRPYWLVEGSARHSMWSGQYASPLLIDLP